MTPATYCNTRLFFASMLLLASSACSTTIEGGKPFAEPILIAGSGTMTEFDAYEPGDPMVIHSGLQTGLWLMPTLRYQGLGGAPDIHCIALDLDKDVILAEGIGHGRSFLFENWFNLQYNMEVTLPDLPTPQVTDLDGYDNDRVLFECNSVDEYGANLDISLEMILSVS